MEFYLAHYLPDNYLLSLFYLVVVIVILFNVSRLILTKVVGSLTENFDSYWSKVIFSPKFLSHLSWPIPLQLAYFAPDIIINLPVNLGIVIKRVSLALLSIMVVRIFTTLLNEFNDVYSSFEQSKQRPIKGIIQVIVILLHCVGFIVMIAALADKEPWYLLSGLGAMTAVLLLVFRDTILSLVAGIQLTTNNLIQVGDWIELKQFGADGDVIDIALHSVKVKNWDNTVTSIPTHKFLENSFVNYRAMQESGGRRIKRSLFIDVSTVRFLTEEEIEKFSHFRLLSKYIADKQVELLDHNKKFEDGVVSYSRRMTNIGTFRIYLENYLKQHPMIHKEMSIMVRQLASGENGIPLEIYAFVNDVRWVYFEKAQSDIFDHIFSIVDEFGLYVHQNPSGHDFQKIYDKRTTSI